LISELLENNNAVSFIRSWYTTASPPKDWQSLLRRIASPKIWTALIIVPVATIAAFTHDWQSEANRKNKQPVVVASPSPLVEIAPTPEQQLKQAQAWLEGDDVKKYSLAVKLLQPLVNEGNTKAINLLASSYFFGLGVKKDEAHGCQLYKKAIDANNTDEKGFYDEKCVKS
jgi:TPR repeat protein